MPIEAAVDTHDVEAASSMDSEYLQNVGLIVNNRCGVTKPRGFRRSPVYQSSRRFSRVTRSRL